MPGGRRARASLHRPCACSGSGTRPRSPRPAAAESGSDPASAAHWHQEPAIAASGAGPRMPHRSAPAPAGARPHAGQELWAAVPRRRQRGAAAGHGRDGAGRRQPAPGHCKWGRGQAARLDTQAAAPTQVTNVFSPPCADHTSRPTALPARRETARQSRRAPRPRTCTTSQSTCGRVRQQSKAGREGGCCLVWVAAERGLDALEPLGGRPCLGLRLLDRALLVRLREHHVHA